MNVFFWNWLTRVILDKKPLKGLLLISDWPTMSRGDRASLSDNPKSQCEKSQGIIKRKLKTTTLDYVLNLPQA